MLSCLLVKLVFMNIFGVFGFRSIESPSLSEIMSDSANYDTFYNHLLQERFLTTYVLSMYERIARMDNKITNEESLKRGSVRVLLPEDDDGVDSTQTLTFNISDVLGSNISLAHLVFNNVERLGGGLGIHTRDNKCIQAVYTDFGYIADVTSIMEQNSDILELKTNISGIRMDSLNAILVIFERFSLSEISRLKIFVFVSQMRRKRSETQGPGFGNVFTSSPRGQIDNPDICGLKPWTLDFGTIGWSSWLWVPTSYEANICTGVCPSPFPGEYYNASGHAFAKNYYHMATRFQDTTVPRACCVPVEFAPLSITYVSKSREVKIKTLPQMKATACGCR